MPANKGGDSKQGLIISLVVSILLVLILGVVSYYGYADKAALEDKAKKAVADKTEMEKNRDWYKYQALQFRNYAKPLGKDEAGDLATLRDRFKGNQLSGEHDAEVKAQVGQLDTQLVKEPGRDNTFESYSDKVERLNNEINNLRTQLARADYNLKKAKSDYDRETATLKASLEDLDKKYNEALAQNLKDRQNQEQNFVKSLSTFGDQNKQIGEIKKRYDDIVADKDREMRKMSSQIKDLQLRVTKLQDKIKTPDLFKYDTPKGQIVRVDPGQQDAYINVGSADNIQPRQNLTFSVFSTSHGALATTERKGAVQVTDILGAHLSRAKIIEQTNPDSAPIVAGDVLVNPAWSPSQRTHVAIAGMIDLTGEGRDTTDEFIRSLDRQGIVVDAYLDLHDMAVKGNGMGQNTDYLILGLLPQFDQQEIEAGDPRVQRKQEISAKIEEMKKKAEDLGITVVPFRRYVALTGYKLPARLGTETGYGYDFIRPSETFKGKTKGETTKKAAPAPKKEDMDKEDKEKDDSDK